MSGGVFNSLTPGMGFGLVNFDFPRWHSYEWSNWQKLDAILLAINATGVSGVWNNATAYVIGERLVDSVNSTIWLCSVAHTSPASGLFSASRTANPTYWSAITSTLNWRGAWTTAVSYFVGDIITFASYKYYQCVAAHTSAAVFSTDAAKWALIVDFSAIPDAYYGYSATVPTTRPSGAAMQAGDVYVSPTGIKMRNATNTAWISPAGDLLSSNNLSDIASAATARTNLGINTLLSHGQCKLVYTNVNTLTLQRRGPGGLVINGILEQTPAAGVTLANGGVIDTNYYVYAFMSGSTMTLERSQTVPVDHTNGVKIKTADSTRTLVGCFRNAGAISFSADAVRSYFNDKYRITKSLAVSADLTGTVTPQNILTQTALTWGSEENRITISNMSIQNLSGAVTGQAIYDITRNGSTLGYYTPATFIQTSWLLLGPTIINIFTGGALSWDSFVLTFAIAGVTQNVRTGAGTIMIVEGEKANLW